MSSVATPSTQAEQPVQPVTSPPGRGLRIACFIPEFPGHTHIWLWREVCGLRECGVDTLVASTRRPAPDVLATHSFAKEVEGQVFYTWPPTIGSVLGCLAYAITHPGRVLRCFRYARALKRDGGNGTLKNLALFLPAWRLARWCKANGVDHVHSATPANSVIVAHMAAMMHPMTTDVTINANLEWWGGAMVTKLSACDAVFVITDWMMDQIRREYPEVVAKKTYLARIGIDTRVWRRQERPESTDGVLRIVSVGRLHPSKGHDDLIRAVKLVSDRGRRVRLEIAGGGPDQGRLSQLIDELGAADVAALVGPLPEDKVRTFMGQADIFVAASHAEPLGVVYMEAMSTGTAVIGTNAGGAPEIIQHEETGLLVPPRDPEALAAAIERLASDRQLRVRLGERASEHVRRNFDSRMGASVIAEQVARLRR